MLLEALSSRYGGFYVPAFSIRIGGGDLVRDHAIGASQVEVDLSLGAMGRFSFTTTARAVTLLKVSVAVRMAGTPCSGPSTKCGEGGAEPSQGNPCV